MVKTYDSGAYLVNGTELIPDGAGALEAVQAKDQKLAEEKYKTLQKALDSARSKGVLKRNAVSRKKSRMMNLYNATFNAAK